MASKPARQQAKKPEHQLCLFGFFSFDELISARRQPSSRCRDEWTINGGDTEQINLCSRLFSSLSVHSGAAESPSFPALIRSTSLRPAAGFASKHSSETNQTFPAETRAKGAASSLGAFVSAALCNILLVLSGLGPGRFLAVSSLSTPLLPLTPGQRNLHRGRRLTPLRFCSPLFSASTRERRTEMAQANFGSVHGASVSSYCSENEDLQRIIDAVRSLGYRMETSAQGTTHELRLNRQNNEDFRRILDSVQSLSHRLETKKEWVELDTWLQQSASEKSSLEKELAQTSNLLSQEVRARVKADKYIKQLEEENLNLKQEKERERSQRADLISYSKNSLSEKSNLEMELGRISDLLSQEVKARERADNYVKQLEEDNLKLRKEQETEQVEVISFSKNSLSEKSNFEKELARISDLLSQEVKARERADNYVKQLEEENSSLKKDKEKVRVERVKLISFSERKKAEKEMLEQSVQHLEEQGKMLQSKFATEQVEKSKFCAEVEHLRELLQSSRDNEKTLKEQIKNLTAEVANSKKSMQKNQTDSATQTENPQGATSATQMQYPPGRTIATQTEYIEGATSATQTENPPGRTTATQTENPQGTTSAMQTENPEGATSAMQTENPEGATSAMQMENPQVTTFATQMQNPPDRTSTTQTEYPEDATSAVQTENPPDRTTAVQTENPEGATSAMQTENPPYATSAVQMENPSDPTTAGPDTTERKSWWTWTKGLVKCGLYVGVSTATALLAATLATQSVMTNGYMTHSMFSPPCTELRPF
ncbi:uncharacterized protein V6R79_009422 [Siganus canaliculatus]